MASLHDVAAKAGVSKTLVSRTVNNQPGVSPVTRERIWEAVRELNYTPNAIARSLVLQKTQTIGVALDNLIEPFFAPLISGIEDKIAESNYDVIFSTGKNDPDRKSRYVDFFSQGRADGVIVYGSNISERGMIERLARTNFPFVVVENQIEDLDINNVLVDNIFGSMLVMDHLFATGCREICHITGDLGTRAAQDRRDGYLGAMRKLGLPVTDGMLVEAGFTIRSGYEATCRFLEARGNGNLPDAIYYGSDMTAFGGMQALLERGIRIPEDIQVAGFDDDRPPPNFTVPVKRLTTLRQPMYDLGVSAVAILLDEISGAATRKQKRTYTPDLILGETTRRPD